MTAEDNPMNEDHSPIDPSILDAFERPAWMDTDENTGSTVHMVVGDVSANCPMNGDIKTYTVEIEYVPDEVILSEDSIREYLYTFQTATIAQESMAELIRTELTEALAVPDVFVDITHEDVLKSVDKSVWAGSV